MANHRINLTLVLTGGGALAAYQVGFLRCVARHHPDLQISVFTGVSAGAFNAAFLASHQGRFLDAVEDLANLWRNLTIDQIFRIDTLSLARNLFGWGLRLSTGLSWGPGAVKGMVDTEPLARLFHRTLSPGNGILEGLEENLRKDRLKALAVTGTNYATGQSVTWVQGRNIATWDRPHRRSVQTEITVDHVLASCALPLLFPAVKVGDTWFGDGGIRQSAPLSPALHLGAERILAITTRYQKTMEEADLPAIPGYPPPAQVLGIMLNAVFLDVLGQDVKQLERINRLIRDLPDPKPEGLRPVNAFLLRPSRDLGRLAGEFEKSLPKTFRFLGRALGTHRTASPDWLSMVLFDPGYLKTLIEIGEADAEGQMGEVEELLKE